MNAVTALAENETFKGNANLGQCLEEHVHTFATDDLADIEEEVAIAEGALSGDFTSSRDRRVNLDSMPASLFIDLVSRQTAQIAK